jgi:hypothetical protein
VGRERGGGQGEGARRGRGQGAHARWGRGEAGCATIHIQTRGAAGLSSLKCMCIYLPSCRIIFSYYVISYVDGLFFDNKTVGTISLSLKGFSCMPVFKLYKLIKNHLLKRKKEEKK